MSDYIKMIQLSKYYKKIFYKYLFSQDEYTIDSYYLMNIYTSYDIIDLLGIEL